jgi:hypothetical protein
MSKTYSETCPPSANQDFPLSSRLKHIRDYHYQAIYYCSMCSALIYIHVQTGTGTGTPTLPVAFKELLPVAASWKSIGTLLGIAPHLLDNIEGNERKVEDSLREMLSKWLKQVTPKPTWAALADAVEPFNETIAHQIRELDNS